MATIYNSLHRIGIRVNKACFSYLSNSDIVLGSGSVDAIEAGMKFTLRTLGGHLLARARHG